MTRLFLALWRTPARPYQAFGLLFLSIVGLAHWLTIPVEGNEQCPPFARFRRAQSVVVAERALDPKAPPASSIAKADEVPTGFLVQPYLQLPSPPTGMSVMWETKDKLPSRVEYGLTRDLGHVVEKAADTNLHKMRLEDLKPGTTYYYRVRSGDVVSETYSFKAAPPLGTKHWRMAVYGDSRTNPATHRKVVEQIAKADVDLILHTGDIVTNGKDHDSWRKQFFEPLEPVMHSVPWVSTIGNHESDSENYFSYMALPGNERYFGFDFADAHIVCLDSNAWIQKGRDSKQFKWMDEYFHGKRDATWTFVAFHHPLFSAHKTRAINALRWDWTPLFLEPECHIDGVLTGHDHFYARNYRMGRLQDKSQPGVLFLTTAGGGASLYPTLARDYVAKEKSAHHFTLFEFDDDRITLTAIDMNGTVIETYTMTKKPTPPDEFCAYEVEEFRDFLRKAIVAAEPIRFRTGDKTVDAELKVPTRFAVPVSGKLIWHADAGWKLKEMEIPFKLEANQALRIPLHAEVAGGPLSASPTLTIAFEPGRFHNRLVEVTPFTLAGPEHVDAGKADKPITLDGELDEKCWAAATEHPLLGLAPRGGRRDGVRVLDDKDCVYVGVRLDDPENRVEVKPAASTASGSRLVLYGEHVRVVLSDGKQTETFALSPEHLLYESMDHRETACKAAAAHQRESWCVEMAISRALFPDWSKVRMNVVHRRQEGKEGLEYQLCPSFTLGNDPDRIPDAKASDEPSKFARLRLD